MYFLNEKIIFRHPEIKQVQKMGKNIAEGLLWKSQWRIGDQKYPQIIKKRRFLNKKLDFLNKHLILEYPNKSRKTWSQKAPAGDARQAIERL